MAQTRTFYDLFGVDCRATPREIRAAYVGLLKQHHPDLSADPSSRAALSQLVADLNVAFETLSDPGKRADYDRQIAAARSLAAFPASTARDVPAAAARSRPESRRFGTFAIAGAFVAVMALLVIEVADAGFVGRMLGMDSYNTDLADLPNRHAADVVAVDQRDVARQVSMATSVPIEQAVGISKQCFDDALDSDKPQATASCIIFDNAVLIWASRSEDDESLPAYFQAARSRARDLDALARWGADDESVLAKLRSAPLHAMLAQIRGTQPAPLPPEQLIKQAQQGQPIPVLKDSGTASKVKNPDMGQTQIRPSQLTRNKLNPPTQGDYR